MPNPLFLAVMKTPLFMYNTYSPAKRDRFQKEAQKRLAELHGTDIEGYIKLTEEVAIAAEEKEEDAAKAAKEDIREEWSND